MVFTLWMQHIIYDIHDIEVKKNMDAIYDSYDMKVKHKNGCNI